MLQLKHLSYSYDTYRALNNVSMTIDAGEIVCLLGPSGCGKTTLLRVIAGLETDYVGDVLLNNNDVRDVAVHERDFGLMFQDFALFPHMTVAENIAYGLKQRQFSSQDIQGRVANMLERVGLLGYEDRDVSSLSGGQKQRVALARSLAPNPRLLMLDEPLGSLDAQLRDDLIIELRDIIQSFGLTAVYVTHDQNEAYAIADKIVVMNQGHIEQVDTPHDLYFQPQTEFVARFLGLQNIFRIEDFEFSNPLADIIRTLPKDNSTKAILVHPTGIHPYKYDEGPCSEIRGYVQQVLFRGDYNEVTVRVDGGLTLQFTRRRIPYAIGERISVFVEHKCIIQL